MTNGNPFAVISDSVSVRFSELSSVISSTAKYYNDNGITEKSFVPILAENSIEYVITIFALWKLGAIPMPINTRLNEKEIYNILNSIEHSKIIVDNIQAKKISEADCIAIRMLHRGEECKKNTTQNPNDIAVIIHTSGSSGKPKGVMITNENLFQSYLISAKEFNYSASDLFLASLPFYHIGGFAIISRMLLSGGALVIPKSLKTNDIVNSMQRRNPSVISLVPTMLKRMLEKRVTPNNGLRLLFLGGGPSDSELIFSAMRAGYPVIKVYGSSETTAMVTACRGKTLKENPASAGHPFPGVEVKILDDTKKELPINSAGEVAVKSPTIAKGYLNDSSLWKSKIYDGFYLSGDYGYLDKNGMLFILARRTDLIISGGENIAPAEIEQAVLEYSGVKDCVVFPVEDKEWGQVPVAAIVTSQKSVEIDKLKRHLKTKLASYKIPAKFLFLAEIPRTALGKAKTEEMKKLISNG